MTEALRQRDEHYFKGIKDVRMIRCMAHHKVPAFNSMEANGGECAVCVVDDIGKARDATIREVEQWKGKAIRVSGEADALEKERDALLVEVGEALGLLGCNGSPLIERVRQRMADLELRTRERDEARREAEKANTAVEGLRAALYEQRERADAAIRERDEARATKDMHKERQEDLEITVQIERERAERAEALLRECLYPLTDRGYPTEELVTKIKGFLS